jgi:hypothetical protein
MRPCGAGRIRRITAYLHVADMRWVMCARNAKVTGSVAGVAGRIRHRRSSHARNRGERTQPGSFDRRRSRRPRWSRRFSRARKSRRTDAVVLAFERRRESCVAGALGDLPCPGGHLDVQGVSATARTVDADGEIDSTRAALATIRRVHARPIARSPSVASSIVGAAAARSGRSPHADPRAGRAARERRSARVIPPMRWREPCAKAGA